MLQGSLKALKHINNDKPHSYTLTNKKQLNLENIKLLINFKIIRQDAEIRDFLSEFQRGYPFLLFSKLQLGSFSECLILFQLFPNWRLSADMQLNLASIAGQVLICSGNKLYYSCAVSPVTDHGPTGYLSPLLMNYCYNYNDDDNDDDEYILIVFISIHHNKKNDFIV